YEIIVIDNGSDDNSISLLKYLTENDIIANLHVSILNKEIDYDKAITVGLERALGDYVLTINLCEDDIQVLPEMLHYSINQKIEIISAQNNNKKHGIFYKLFELIFCKIYKLIYQINFITGYKYRLLHKNVVNF